MKLSPEVASLKPGWLAAKLFFDMILNTLLSKGQYKYLGKKKILGGKDIQLYKSRLSSSQISLTTTCSRMHMSF